MRTAMSRSSRLVAAAALTLLTVAGTAGAANATTPQGTASPETAGCPSSGQVDVNYVCTSLTSGAVYHRKYTNDVVSSWYVKTGGSAITATLGFSGGGVTKTSAKFTETSGQTVTKTWSGTGVSYCALTVGILTVDGQGSFQTPQASC